MKKQLTFNDVYPDAFPPNENNAEPREETQREAREGDGAAAAGIGSPEYNEQLNNVLDTWRKLKANMETENYRASWALSELLHKELDRLRDLTF